MINFIKKFFSPKYTPYCTVCSGCGEEGCCSPIVCRQDPKGKYCKSYLRDLKDSYRELQRVYKEVYSDEIYYDKLIKILEE